MGKNLNEIEMNKRKKLSLDTIMVLRIYPNDNYMITMAGPKGNNSEERILLRNGQKEKLVIEKCLQDNIELERKSITNYMPSDYIELYNEALNIGRTDCCFTMLRGIEKQMNRISKEKNKLMTLSQNEKKR